MLTPMQDIPARWALIASLLAGEGAVGVTRPLRTTRAAPYWYREWAGSAALPADEIMVSGPGILRNLYIIHDIRHAASVGNLDMSIYDNTAASGPLIHRGRITSIVAAAAVGATILKYEIEKEFTFGLFLDYSAWSGVQPTAGNIYLSATIEG